MLSHRDMKILIETAGSVEQADAIVSRAWCTTDAEKLWYVRQLFGYEEIAPVTENPHDEYYSLLEGIVSSEDKDVFKEGFRTGYIVGYDDSDPDGLWADLCKLAAMTGSERERRFGYPYVDMVILSTDLSMFKEKMAAWKLMEGRDNA